MVDKETIYATLIDFIGIILMFTSILFLPIIFMLTFPLACYIITYHYFKEKFWKAFWISIGLMVVLFMVGIFLILYTPIGLSLLRMKYGV
ncbi:MAG: hypothetical protein DRP03_02690 [Candidatus Aenigmatarchaeota archaeon]|nr:MAG: hypothetical protein DRP03_02690 [Candidatus Aenigmarchaeota archaeon]